MKKLFYSIAAIACISSNLLVTKAAQALEEGLYWGGGSRYIQIAKKASSTSDNDRVCYQGFSSNGTLISSLKLIIPRYQTGIDYEIYSLQSSLQSSKNSLSNLSIQQNAASRDKLIFGKLFGRFVREGLVYKRDLNSISERSPDLQECLNSDQPYFKQILSGRDRR